MISEKTVELNLTSELINILSCRFNTSRIFAIGPSLKEEARNGYDVSVGPNGMGILIQFKRAYAESNEYVYHINYTKQRDQHQRLLELEKKGYPVYYALPIFHLESHIALRRCPLVMMTAWFKPSQITIPAGITGRHKVHFNRHSISWTVTSKEHYPITKPLTIKDVIRSMINEDKQKNMLSLIRDVNNIIFEGIPKKELPPATNDFLIGQIIMGAMIEE